MLKQMIMAAALLMGTTAMARDFSFSDTIVTTPYGTYTIYQSPGSITIVRGFPKPMMDPFEPSTVEEFNAAEAKMRASAAKAKADRKASIAQKDADRIARQQQDCNNDKALCEFYHITPTSKHHAR